MEQGSSVATLLLEGERVAAAIEKLLKEHLGSVPGMLLPFPHSRGRWRLLQKSS